MKKSLMILIILCGHLFALEQGSTLKLYHQILTSLVKKEKVKTYTKDMELATVFKSSDKIIPVQNPVEADVVIVGNDDTYEQVSQMLSRYGNPEKAIFFATNYHLLKNAPQAVGALYWKKGRSQLLFIKPRLQQRNIVLPETFQPFIIDSL